MKNPGKIKNKVKRTEVYAKYKIEKSKKKKRLRDEKKKNEEELGKFAPKREIPKTLENMRKFDETKVKDTNNLIDDEILEDEKDDEFAKYFNNEMVILLYLFFVL